VAIGIHDSSTSKGLWSFLSLQAADHLSRIAGSCPGGSNPQDIQTVSAETIKRGGQEGGEEARVLAIATHVYALCTTYFLNLVFALQTCKDPVDSLARFELSFLLVRPVHSTPIDIKDSDSL